MYTYDNITMTVDGKPLAMPGIASTYDIRRRKPIVPTFMIDGVMYAFHDAPLCRKCAGHGTRAHARKCPERGLGHKNRGAEAECVEQLSLCAYGVFTRIRRGRHGRGVSLPVARRTAARYAEMSDPSMGTGYAQKLGVNSEASYTAIVKTLLGDSAKVTVKPHGIVEVTADVVTADIIAELREHTPMTICLKVNGDEA